MAQSRIAGTLTIQHKTAQAQAHYAESVRLAERACELSGHRLWTPLSTLVCVYGNAKRFDEAIALAGKARERALAEGQLETAESFREFAEHFKAEQSAEKGNPN